MNRRGFLAALVATPIAIAVGEVMARDVPTDIRNLVADLDVADTYPKWERLPWQDNGPDREYQNTWAEVPPRWDADGRDTHHPMYVTKEMVGLRHRDNR